MVNCLILMKKKLKYVKELYIWYVMDNYILFYKCVKLLFFIEINLNFYCKS